MEHDVPERLAVELRHEGFVVASPYQPARTAALASVAVVAVGAAAASAASWALVLVGLVGMGVAGVGAGAVAAMLAVAIWPASWRVEVNQRWVVVERRGPLGAKTWRIGLDDLQRWYVAEPREDYSGHFLVLQAKAETVRVTPGWTEQELKWIAKAIDEVVAAKRRFEQVEGREYGFQKQAPEAITGLVERS